MDAMNQEFQMFFQNATIMMAGSTALFGMCVLLALTGATDLFSKSRQDKRRATRNMRL